MASTTDKKTARDVALARDRKSAFAPELSVSHEAMLIDGKDEVFRNVLFLTRLFADRLLMFREAIAKSAGLSGNQYVILLSIAHSQGEGGVAVRDVAHYTLMASTHVTTQAGALIRKGLVSKRPNHQDGRSVLLVLTAKGERVMYSIAALRRQFNDAFFEGVSRNSLLVAQKMLNQISDNSEQALPLLRSTSPAASTRKPKKAPSQPG